jgi:hypothetical protein
MGLNCGIVGLPNVGKSTIFSALTSAPAEAANYPFCTIEPNVGIVHVPDARMEKIGKIIGPERMVPAIVEFVDIAGLVKGASKGEGLGNQFLGHIRQVGATCHVVRCFEDDDIVHVAGKVDPISDIEVINIELALADLETVTKRIQNLDKMLKLRSDIHFLTGGLIAESQDYLSSFKYLYEALDRKEILFNRQLLEMLYPTPYLSDLKSTLKNSGFDPIIVLSLIRQESVFNPEARSPVGARGLMQLMPATAKRFQRSVREKQLVQPKRNMEIGTKYFQQLMKRFDGNLVYVLASYNAGENRVDRWKTTYFNEDETILKNIEMIPFLETRNYVKLIFRNIFFYKLLIDGEQEQVNPELNKIYNVALGFKK